MRFRGVLSVCPFYLFSVDSWICFVSGLVWFRDRQTFIRGRRWARMNTRTMYVLSFAVYLVFVIALIATLCFFDLEEDSKLMAMYVLSSGLMVCTLILAVVFMRSNASDRYRELYMEQDKDWEKKN